MSTLILTDPRKTEGDIQYPRRKGYSTEGEKIILRTNYFRMRITDPKQQLYRYEIKFNKELAKQRKARVVELLLKKPEFRNYNRVTDFASNVITTMPLPSSITQATFTVEYHHRHEDPLPQTGHDSADLSATRARKTVEATLQFVAQLSLEDFLQDLNSTSATAFYPHRKDVVQAYNIVLNFSPRVDYSVAAVGQNRFLQLDKGREIIGNYRQTADCEWADLGGGLRAVRGYASSARIAQPRLLANIKVVARAFYNPVRLTDLMNQFMSGSGYSTTSVSGLRDLQRFLKNLKVQTRYTQETDATGKVIKDQQGRPTLKRKVFQHQIQRRVAIPETPCRRLRNER